MTSGVRYQPPVLWPGGIHAAIPSCWRCSWGYRDGAFWLKYIHVACEQHAHVLAESSE